MNGVETRRNTIRAREIGRRYGRLVVVDLVWKPKMYAVCNCDCGGSITVQAGNLYRGATKSCGCISEEYEAKARGDRPYARTRSPLYGTWRGMMSRCFNERNGSYGNYGGRGITVCNEWQGEEGFDRFEKWSYENGYAPESGLSLDRIDVNGNYEPGNCRYANRFIQAVNQRPPKRRATKKYCIDGKEKTLRQWCDEYGISKVAVKYRMDTLGMDIETALKTPKTRKGNAYAGKQAAERQAEKVRNLNKCQSYIEANLYTAAEKKGIILIPQYEIGNFRADFLIAGTSIVIECDGYDAHKTKEQIRSDYARERSMIAQGYTVIRFSGTEINEDPDACCDEILTLMEAISNEPSPYRPPYNRPKAADHKAASE